MVPLVCAALAQRQCLAPCSLSMGFYVCHWAEHRRDRRACWPFPVLEACRLCRCRLVGLGRQVDEDVVSLEAFDSDLWVLPSAPCWYRIEVETGWLTSLLMLMNEEKCCERRSKGNLQMCVKRNVLGKHLDAISVNVGVL